MKTLVVYYSKSGNTRRVAEEIGKALEADVEEIREAGVDRSGVMGFLRAGRDGMRRRTSTIEAAKKRPADYGLVLVGSPVWGGNLVPAVRSYLATAELAGRPVAFFCTIGGAGGKKTFASMRELARGAQPLGELTVLERELQSPETLAGRVSAWAREMATKASASAR